MKTSLSAPTAEHRRRFSIMQEIGCIACLLDGRPGNPGDIHHILSGGRRVSHHVTLCLCPWHHRGVPPNGLQDRMAERVFGPSLAKSPASFKRQYGTDVELLEIQNRLIEERTNATAV
jgi:hypothetical protein